MSTFWTGVWIPGCARLCVSPASCIDKRRKGGLCATVVVLCSAAMASRQYSLSYPHKEGSSVVSGNSLIVNRHTIP